MEDRWTASHDCFLPLGRQGRQRVDRLDRTVTININQHSCQKEKQTRKPINRWVVRNATPLVNDTGSTFSHSFEPRPMNKMSNNLHPESSLFAKLSTSSKWVKRSSRNCDMNIPQYWHSNVICIRPEAADDVISGWNIDFQGLLYCYVTVIFFKVTSFIILRKKSKLAMCNVQTTVCPLKSHFAIKQQQCLMIYTTEKLLFESFFVKPIGWCLFHFERSSIAATMSQCCSKATAAKVIKGTNDAISYLQAYRKIIISRKNTKCQ